MPIDGDGLASGLAMRGEGRTSVIETTEGRVAGPWPQAFPILGDGKVREGLVAYSQSGTIEGRTTGARRPCITNGCPGWFIGVRWETGQLMHICSQGWAYDPETETVRVTGGGEISARFVAPKPLGTPPLPRDQWPTRGVLSRWAGWRAARTATSDSDDGERRADRWRSEVPDSPTDDEIEEHLRSTSASTWRTLRDHIDAIDHLTNRYTWHGGERDEGTHTMPFVAYDERVSAVISLLYEMGVVVVFDWMNWDGVRRFGDAEGLASAPGADVARWLTALVRSERFGEGSIAATLDDGRFLAALVRLVQVGEDDVRGRAGDRDGR